MNHTKEHHSSPFFNVIDFDAAGDGKTLDTPAIQAAMEACARSGGGTVYFPAGRYLTGPIHLHDQVTLHLDSGAVLLGSTDIADYPVEAGRWEGADQLTYASLITGSNLHHVTITGRGVIDGQGHGWWDLHRQKQLKYPRPRQIGLTNCQNVLVEGVTLTNSPSWTINPVHCDMVTIDKVTIQNPIDSPNTDGINPDSCSNVRISNCYVSVGDDCITLKSGKEDNGRANLSPCENIAITNCIMADGHGGVVIGSEMSGGVRRVVISNCVFKGTDRGLRFKSRRGRGGVVEDIRVSNIIMEDVLCPITMNLYYACGAWGNQDNADKNPHPVDESTPVFRRIHLSSITAREVKIAAGFLYGLAEMPLENITLSDISISMAQNAPGGYPEMADDLEVMQQAGFFACHADRLRMNNIEVSGQKGPAFILKNMTRLEMNACTTQTPPGRGQVFDLHNVDMV